MSATQPRRLFVCPPPFTILETILSYGICTVLLCNLTIALFFLIFFFAWNVITQGLFCFDCRIYKITFFNFPYE